MYLCWVPIEIPTEFKDLKLHNCLISITTHVQCVLTCSTKAETKKHLSPMMGSDMNNARPNKATFFSLQALSTTLSPPQSSLTIGDVHKTRQTFL